jgi:hypothetical protein
LIWLKIPLCNFFSFKILWIATVFSHIVFLFYFFIFFKIIFIDFFLYWTDWEFSFVIFSFKHCWLLQYFFAWFFFVFVFFMIFSKIIFFLFYFLILSWLKIIVTICEEIIVPFLANYCRLLQCFFIWFFFLFCYIFL